jgi:hypothetical protein
MEKKHFSCFEDTLYFFNLGNVEKVGQMANSNILL